MRQTQRLLKHKTLLTLFTRANCSLCDNAKSVIEELTKKKNFDFHQVDVMAPDHRQWRLLYEFDAPVVRFQTSHERSAAERNPKLHVQRVFHTCSKSALTAHKLMHRFDERQVEELIDEVERDS